MPRVVLVDHAAENLASLDRQVQRRAGLAVVVRWSFLAGLVRAVSAVMVGVLARDQSQVPFAVDEHPVGALGSCGAYPSPGVTVRPRACKIRRTLAALIWYPSWHNSPWILRYPRLGCPGPAAAPGRGCPGWCAGGLAGPGTSIYV